jgi:hypothetical protein
MARVEIKIHILFYGENTWTVALVIREWWRMGKDLLGSGRGLIWGTIPAFAWWDWRKPRKTSVSIAGRQGRDLKAGPTEYEATRPRLPAAECGVVLRQSTELQTSKRADTQTPAVSEQHIPICSSGENRQRLQIRSTAGDAPGNHVAIGQCSFQALKRWFKRKSDCGGGTKVSDSQPWEGRLARRLGTHVTL